MTGLEFFNIEADNWDFANNLYSAMHDILSELKKIRLRFTPLNYNFDIVEW